jgi:glycosyltransferase involved in cell wall biosynthesis
MINNGYKMMLFSHLCSESHITGAEKLLLLIIQELSRWYECILVVPNEGLLAMIARERGFATIVHSYPLMLSMYNPGPQLQENLEQLLQDYSFRSLAQLLLSHRPDLVLINTCLNVLPAIAAKTIGIPVVWMITEKMIPTAHIQQSVELINRNADWIIGISHCTLDSFQNEEMQGKTRILHPSWRMEELERESWPFQRYTRRTQMGLDETQKVVGYISSDIYPNKGLDHFVQMAICLCDRIRHVHFFIVGRPTDPVFYQNCVHRIQESGYESRFHFASFEKQIQKVYPAMDIVVIPSLINEGFGMTALEGLVFGKPVVSYRSGGLEEALTLTGNEDFLVNKGDIAGLEEKVSRLLLNESLSKEVGKRNGKVVQEVFGIEPFRNRLHQYLAELWERVEATNRPKSISSQTLFHRPYTLLIQGSDTTVYLLHEGVKYPFPSESVFKSWQYRFDQVITVSNSAIKSIISGNPVNGIKPEKGKRKRMTRKKLKLKRKKKVIKK